MIRVNNKSYKIYELDTPSTLIQRIAKDLNTIPKYLYFPQEFSMDKKEMTVVDILSKIKRNAATSTDFISFLAKIQSKFPIDLDIEKDILYIWLIYNESLKTMFNKHETKKIDEFAKPLIDNKYFSSEKNFTSFWKADKEGIRNRLNKEIQQNKIIVDSNISLYKTLEDIKEGPKYTSIVIQKVNFVFRIDLMNTTLLELFNMLQTDETIPFAVSKEYYKILKDFIPPEDWAITTEDLILKVSTKEVVNSSDYDNYTDVRVFTNENSDIFTEMSIIIARGNLNREQFIRRILDPFSDDVKIQYSNIKETEIAALFYFPQFRLDTYVFSDLVMNDPLFSYLINTDESTKVTKRKSDTSNPWLYLHVNHPSLGHITAGIIQKIVTRDDTAIRDFDRELFPYGSPYLRIRVKGENKEVIYKFQKIFSKLLEQYKYKKDEIIKYYRQFIPDFGKVVEEKIQNIELKPKNIAPEIFITNYTRICKDDRMPKIVDEKEASIIDKPITKFPRDKPKDGVSYPSDGVNQNLYYCPNPDYPYFGVQKNRLDNSDKFPYVPCCFAQPQNNKQIWRHYFLNESLDNTKESKQQDLIKTDKILGYEKYGELSSELSSLFELLDTNPKFKYIRLGVDRDYNSFISAVMISLYKTTDILSLTDDERIQKIDEIREKFSGKKLAPLCRQCQYDVPIKDTRKIIKNNQTYFDPKLYIQILENYFDCNIYLFNRERMIMPRHLETFYKMDRVNKPCIFIYEHWGSESDHASYPQCELIIKWQLNTPNTRYVFKYDSDIAFKIRMMYNMISKSYILNKPVSNIVFPLKSKIVSQSIDSYGKCRQLNLSYKDRELTIFTDPLPPQKAKEYIYENYNKTEYKLALEFIKDEEGDIISQTVCFGILKEIKLKIGNVNVILPIENGKPLKEVPIVNKLFYPKQSESQLELYNYNKKMARYIVEYMYWWFSKYIHKNNIKTIEDRVLKNFAKKQTTIIPDYEYPYIKKTFTTNDGIIKDDKLVITSKEMLKRLMYVLKLYSIRDLNALLNYKNKTVIQNYYQDITDFTQHPKYVILYGEESIEKWIQENRSTYKLYDTIVTGSRVPYFFKNKLISSKIFLAQNINTVSKAIYIAKKWYKSNYNISVYAKDSDVVSFILYRYINKNNISIYKIEGENTPIIKILGYKSNNVPFYTVLLPLDISAQ